LKKNLLVLAYHRILGADEPSAHGPGHVYDISEQVFRQQIDLLLAEKCHFVSLDHAVAETMPGKLNVALSFDDGYASDWMRVFPILAERGLPASFLIAPKATDLPAVNWEKIKMLHRHGFTIGSHGLTHTALTDMAPQKRKQELVESASIISDHIGERPGIFSFPFGRYNRPCAEDAQEAGYQYALTTRFRKNEMADPVFLLHRWSVKKTTGLQTFKRVLNGHLAEKIFRQVYSEGVFGISRITGHRFMNRLHQKINHGQ
jgi:peptidoglycan/xylan/chitin deacetylase (PgdA/CDA1 family)